MNFVPFLAFACVVQLGHAYSDFDPPKIYPATPYVTYKSGQTATFRCEGTQYGVTWLLPPDASESMKRRVSVVHSINHEYFSADLSVRDLNYTDTGSLVCAYNGTTDLTDIDNSSSIHLFVEDKRHLLKYSGFEFFQAVQSQTFVLPCMPTNPEVSVSLWKMGRQVELDHYIQFDPKVGYRISPITTKLHSGDFECKATLGDLTDSFPFDITVRQKTMYVPPPQINNTLALYVRLGDPFTLVCSVMVDFNTIVELTWATPNPEAIEDRRLRVPEPVAKNLSLPETHLKVVEQALVVERAHQEDQGSYSCTVTDHAGNVQTKSKFVHIQAKDEPRLQMWMEGFQTYDVTIGKDDTQTIQWVVHFNSHPQPSSIEWFGPDGRRIDDTPTSARYATDFNVKNYLDNLNSRTVLKVNKLKLANAGNYSVKISNGNLTQTETFSLIIRSAPKAKILLPDPQGLYKKGQNYTMKCTAEGYPIPDISWVYKPCSAFNECTRHNSLNLQSNVSVKISNTFSRSAMIFEVANRSGEFSCLACNKVGCTLDTVPFFVTDVPEGGFHVDGPRNVLVGESIDLTCSASVYNFSAESIEWFKDSLSGPKRLEASSESHRVSLTSTDFSATKVLHLLNVTLGDKGRYMCRVRKAVGDSPHAVPATMAPKASRRSYYSSSRREEEDELDLEDESSHVLSLNLNVLPLEPPVFIETNMGVASRETTIVEQPEDGLELKCRMAGRPWPLISWYLNGAKLYPTLNTTRVQITDDNQAVKINYVSKSDEGVYECHAENRVGHARASQVVLLRSTADKDALYSRISLPVILAVIGALLLVALLIGLAKVCYARKKKKAAKVAVTAPNLQPWKEPPTPPTPRLTQFDLANSSSTPHTSYSTNEDDECRVTLTSTTRGDDDRSVSPANSFHPSSHPCCTYITAPAAATAAMANNGHCHYQALPMNEVIYSPCQMSSKISICECSASQQGMATLNRHFPHLYSRTATPSFNSGTLHRFNHYENHHHLPRSRSHSPSRRSAEY